MTSVIVRCDKCGVEKPLEQMFSDYDDIHYCEEHWLESGLSDLRRNRETKLRDMEQLQKAVAEFDANIAEKLARLLLLRSNAQVGQHQRETR